MRYFFFILIIFFSSCNSNKFTEDKSVFTGDWKRTHLTRDGENVDITLDSYISFRSDNLMFYFNRLVTFDYHSNYDSLFLLSTEEEDSGAYVRRFKVDFTDVDQISLTFKRKMLKDTVTLDEFWMIYKATYEKMN